VCELRHQGMIDLDDFGFCGSRPEKVCVQPSWKFLSSTRTFGPVPRCASWPREGRWFARRPGLWPRNRSCSGINVARSKDFTDQTLRPPLRSAAYRRPTCKRLCFRLGILDYRRSRVFTLFRPAGFLEWTLPVPGCLLYDFRLHARREIKYISPFRGGYEVDWRISSRTPNLVADDIEAVVARHAAMSLSFRRRYPYDEFVVCHASPIGRSSRDWQPEMRLRCSGEPARLLSPPGTPCSRSAVCVAVFKFNS